MDLTGKTLRSKYRVETILGQGGMGSVYAGVHTVTGRRVAIKVLDERFLTNMGVVQRFGREARAASAVQHEGIVEVIDLDQTDEGLPFLVMEFLEGETLTKRISSRGRLNQDEIVKLAEKILPPLEAAHKAGVIHRDLKPDNIILVPAGRRGDLAKILDFGISSKADETQKLTMEGSVLGTPHYMSPEQALGKADLDARVDIYSMGVVFYECAVGDVPFDAGNYNALMQAILQSPVPTPISRGATITPTFEAAILRAMARRREDRATTALDLLRELQDAAGGKGPLMPTSTSTSSPTQKRSPDPLAQTAAANPALTQSGVRAGDGLEFDPFGDNELEGLHKEKNAPPRASMPEVATKGLDFGDTGQGAALELDDSALERERPRASKPEIRAIQTPRAATGLNVSSSQLQAARMSMTNPMAGGAGMQSGTMRRVVPAAPQPQASESSLAPKIVTALLVLLVLAGAGYIFANRKTAVGTTSTRASTVAEPAVPARRTPTTTTGPAEWVMVSLDGLPEGARLALDGLPGASLPMRLRKGTTHVLQITHDRFQSMRLEFEADSDRTMTVAMTPAAP